MLDQVNEQLRRLHTGRKMIVAAEAAAGAVGEVRELRELGAETLVVAGVRGVGRLPEDTPIVCLPNSGPAASLMAGIRRFLGAIADPPAEVQAAVDRFDPSAEAEIIAPPFGRLTRALGRRVAGAGRPGWWALEDKMRADEIWDAAGVARAPAANVPVRDAAGAAARLAGERGSVWVADNRQGWHGGAEYVRWLEPGADPAPLLTWFEGRSHRVRVMPFLEGIPCSIHGFVTRRAVAAFRPVEMVVLRELGRSRLVYGGMSSFWDPAPEDRDEMRAAARRAGALLRSRVDYRGPFSIDGVMTADGFRPTELNPRFSSGFGGQGSAAVGLKLGVLTRAFIDGRVDVDADWLESVVVQAADGTRFGGMGLSVTGAAPAEDEIAVRFSRTGIEMDEGSPDGTLGCGSGMEGTFVKLNLDPDRTRAGPPVAPKAALAASLAAERWALPIPPLVAAPEVRSAAGGRAPII